MDQGSPQHTSSLRAGLKYQRTRASSRWLPIASAPRRMRSATRRKCCASPHLAAAKSALVEAVLHKLHARVQGVGRRSATGGGSATPEAAA